MRRVPKHVSTEDLGDGMKQATYRLPTPEPGKVWYKVHGEVPDDMDWWPDPSDGGKWIQCEPIETGGQALDLSEYFSG